MNHRAFRERASDWRPESREARQLAGWLRSERLTIVLGPDRSELTSLLASGVLPLLGRRSVDAVAQPADIGSRVVIPFPERRGRRAGTATEVLILLDASREPTLELLEARFDVSVRAAGYRPSYGPLSLAGRVQALTAQHDARMLFVIDGFEALLAASDDDARDPSLVDALVELLDAALPANVLLAVHAGSKQRVAAFAHKLDDVEPAWLELPGNVVPIEPDAPFAPEPLAVRDIPVLDVAAVVEPRMRHAAVREVSIDRASEDTQADANVDTRQDSWPAPGEPDDAFAPASPTPAPLESASRRKWQSLGAVGVFLGVCAWAWFASDGREPARQMAASRSEAPVRLEPETQPRQAEAPRSASSQSEVSNSELPKSEVAYSETPHTLPPQGLPQAAATLGVPTLQLIVEGDGTSAPRTARELAGALGFDGKLSVTPRVTKDVTASIAALPAHQATLAIVRYDALQALSKAARPVVVIAPLYTEDLLAIARADSPMRHLHELRQKRIDVGPADGGRAAAARALYGRMFDAPLPRVGSSALDATESLRRLARGEGLDAVLLVGSQVEAAWARLTPDERRALKPLSLASDDPASVRAARGYLSVKRRAGPNGMADEPFSSLAALDFLVVTGSAEQLTPTNSPWLAAAAASLCHRLAALQREGDPKWREVTAGLQLPLALPHVRANPAGDAWKQCPTNS